ncbi:MAG: hypothetical protein HZC17_06970, partial [Candidatus Omnitrophica bacterium]|nr:hypothetical protein [Candidatus Omnitrophota bacterium]
IADFRILSALNARKTILLARDKAGQGANHDPVSLTEIRNIEREGADSALFNLGWDLLSAPNAGYFRDQIEQDSSTGVLMIRLAALSNFIEQWLRERENTKQILFAA